ncbi:helix-turn-helix domain-containing protein [Corynebacterium glutamicum]|uniref:helix-turn-helix domain-containing protein n=1 Tax=Corynebacterium glutamicum TaxID=1718 RepID=UPI001B8D2084|nr:helix-turn-helix transcriptional regulator [Corynebacterium glutamicum]
MTPDKKILIQLGGRIRDVRKGLGISQEELAHLSGMHRTYVSSVERGERNISVLNLLSLAGVLGVDAGDLVTGLTRKPRIKP